MPKTSPEKKEKPRVFIGSSVEGLHIANSIQILLEHIAEPTVWTQGVFEPTGNTLEDLIDLLDRIDFGIFVFSPDDVSKIRKQRFVVARDNVIFEMGLFIGRLGKKRVFYIIPRHREKFHLPSDLLGVAPLDYDNNRSDGNIQAALGSPCTKIAERISSLGRFGEDVSVVESKSTVEISAFTKQEESEFNHIYEKLKPIRYTAISVFKKYAENGKWIQTEIGRCEFRYYLIKIIWLHLERDENVFNNFLSSFHDEAEEVAKSNLAFFDSDHSFGYGFYSSEESDLIPLMRRFGLLEKRADNSPQQLIPDYTYYIYSEKMLRFLYWIDYYNKIINQEPIEFVEFIEKTD